MSAVWRASRAAVKRRRLQTFIIGLVVLTSTVTLVVALGLLDATSAPFDRTFAQQRGAHAVVTFDPAKVTDAQLTEAAHRAGATGVAGPFAEAVFDVPPRTGLTEGVYSAPPGPITVVGRADPGGPVDRVDVWHGRWVSGPGEVVLMRPPGMIWGPNGDLGSRLLLPGAPPLTIVGFASSLSETAGAWVWPGQLPALHAPTATQMLYRFADAGTDSQVGAGVAAATAGLPQGAVVSSLSYLTVKQDMTSTANAYVPFLMAFGILGLVVALLIVANVVSGAVVSGFRHIGVLKSLGFTPNQVVSVYLVMVLVPTAFGTALGTVLGDLAAQPLLRMVFSGFDAGYFNPVLSHWVEVVTMLGMPAVVLLAALVPALRAHSLSAARAISAGSAPSTGRGLRVQRRLSGTRLPRAVSLGLGLPFARPGRTALTLTSLVLGVTAVTFATGLSSSVNAYTVAGKDPVQSVSYVGDGTPERPAPKLTDPQIEAKLRTLPGALHVTAAAPLEVHMAGDPQIVRAWFLRGDSANTHSALVHGRWMNGPGEVVVGTPFVQKHGLSVGDHLTLELGSHQETVTIAGETMTGNADMVTAPWETLTALAPDWTHTRYINQYWVQLAPGADVGAYNAAAKAAEPGLEPNATGDLSSVTVTIVGSSSLLTLLLGTVAALGVFNTVVLNTRERRRDFGMLKSIGMTPRQVTAMVVTSMAALGAVGGLLGVPLGIGAHRIVVPAMVQAIGSALPDTMLHVWHAPTLAAMVLAGVGLAVLGALIPAVAASRLTIAEVLRNE